MSKSIVTCPSHLSPAHSLGKADVQPLTAMRTLSTNMAQLSRSRELQLREAVLLTFCDPPPNACSRLGTVSQAEWPRLLRWLDTSGLALYFLHRIDELEQAWILPRAVHARLQQNLVDNTARTESMIAELSAINRKFQLAALSYAMLKGFSLWPSSVPRPELRSQLDLDFLVAEESAPEARLILEGRGYHLRAISGRTWEFKKNETPGTTLKDLYRNIPCRSVELHIESGPHTRSSLLSRAEVFRFRDLHLPVLSSADLFLGQGLHAFKHICSEFSRTAHLLEFRRHVLSRRDDPAFWSRLRSRAEEDQKAVMALGVVTLLIAQVTGEFAPKSLTSWTVDTLPSRVQRWVRLYGTQAAYASFPGNKLYLLLQKELATDGSQAKRSMRRALLPLSLPPLIVHGRPGETLSMRLRRYRAQISFILFRLHFHLVEGFRYLRESLRWRREVSEAAR
jgi:putative nucleotidyltransferase-like protein